jgi:hypothetical protein
LLRGGREEVVGILQFTIITPGIFGFQTSKYAGLQNFARSIQKREKNFFEVY